jgi:hypothetical protein
MQAYLIDSTARTITAVEYKDGDDLRAFLGGYLEAAWHSPAGDVLYVDEEGMYKAKDGSFMFEGRPDQPLHGNGVIVGRELIDNEGDYLGNAPPSFGIGQLTRVVRFVDRAFVDAWGKANASEPASGITYVNDEGQVVTETTATWGQMIRDIPRPPEKEAK